MCALSFVPGGKSAKIGLKGLLGAGGAIGGIGLIGSKAAKSFGKSAEKKALKELALEKGGNVYRCTDRSAGHVAQKHLDDIAKNSGSRNLADTTNTIKREWNAVNDAKWSGSIHDPPRLIYYSDNMKFVVEPETSTIVSMMWR
jgi:hypothetical protein